MATWVALAIVQDYNDRRRVARSDVQLPALESALQKIARVAAQRQGGCARTENLRCPCGIPQSIKHKVPHFSTAFCTRWTGLWQAR